MKKNTKPRILRIFKNQLSNRVLFISGVAALVATGLSGLDFNLFEATLYDLQMSQGPQPQASQDIVLVALDDTTTQELEDVAPLELKHHTTFLEALESYEPRAVGYLVDLNRASTQTELNTARQDDRKFLATAERFLARGTPFLLGTPFDVTGEVMPPYPLSTLPHSIAIIHKDGNLFSEDKITRRALGSLYEKPSFHLEFARKLGSIKSFEEPRGSFYVPETDGRYFFFRYHGSTQTHAPQKNQRARVLHSPEHPPYLMVSFVDILKKRVDTQLLKGKVILVGSLNREDPNDFAFTPYSKNAFTNPKLIVHANILDAVMHHHTLVRVPSTLTWLISFATCSLVLWWVVNSTPLYGVFATLSLSLVVFVMSMLAFSTYGLWLKLSQPLVGIFLSYYLVVPYRLVREYKKRWDYQRKNEVLTQVEELKTNFLSLVTHDLKTPVARIQGLAEVLLRKAHERLNERDRETIESMIAATDELNRFISSTLELTKVESNHIQIQLESKDINQLIEKVTENFKASSRARQVKLVMLLEPLFPIKVDSGLIIKILNNVIDNALKYSPAHTEVTVCTQEIDKWVVISGKD